MIFRKRLRRAEVQVPITHHIEEIVGSVPGWTPTDQLLALFSLVFATKDLPGDIVEIGCWAGRSTAVFGLAARLVGDTHLHCIDLFPGKDDWCLNDDVSYSFAVTVRGVLYKAYQETRGFGRNRSSEISCPYMKNTTISLKFFKRLC
jgi:hypothetical protein